MAGLQRLQRTRQRVVAGREKFALLTAFFATLSGTSAIAWNDPNAPWQEKKNEPTAHTIQQLDKPAMRLYGIFSTVEGPWGAGGGMTWTDEDVAAASHLEMAFPVR